MLYAKRADMELTNIQGHTFYSCLNSKSVVLDIGGNQGRFSSGIISNFGCTIACYEPDPHACICIENYIKHDKFTLVKKAVAGSSGRRNFYSCLPMSGGNSLLPGSREWGKNPHTETVYEVDVESLENALAPFEKIDLLKMDCEGAEIEAILNTTENALKKCNQITIEFHDFCFKQLTLQDVMFCVDKLKNIGFETLHKDFDDCLFYKPEILK